MDLLLGKQPLLAILSNHKKKGKKTPANCFEVNGSGRPPDSKCKTLALLVMRHECLFCEEK